jgi:RHS repeat-associated protein
MTYDANGNTLSDASGRSFTWDFENRLVQAVVPGTSGGTTTFKYDPFGRRIQKSGPLGTVNYVYDGRNLLEELDASANLLARYTDSKSIDDPLSEIRSSMTSYYNADGLQSVTSLSNTSSTLVSTYAYDTFGNITNSTGTIVNAFRFTGREFDAETGIYFYRARYFDPRSGRFISEDPSGFRGGTNFYLYARNSPITLKDPLGLMACVQTPLGLICYDDHQPGTTTLNPGLPGLPRPPELKPPQPVNICNQGQIALFSLPGPNPYQEGGKGEDAWYDFKDKFIDRCEAAGPNTVTMCTQGAGVLGPFAYCSCCQDCGGDK